MSHTDDTADAAMRLENALERIAMLAARRQELPMPGPMPAAQTAEAASTETHPDLAVVTTRLDSLIAQIRGALG